MKKKKKAQRTLADLIFEMVLNIVVICIYSSTPSAKFYIHRHSLTINQDITHFLQQNTGLLDLCSRFVANSWILDLLVLFGKIPDIAPTLHLNLIFY